MDTYLSAFHMLRDLRESLGEYSNDLMRGRDTSGAYSNTWLTRRINEAQWFLYAFLIKTIPDEFYEEASITAVASELTLPWNFGRIIQLRDSNGSVVTPVKPKQRPAQSAAGSLLCYYRKGQSLYLTRSGVTDTYTLYFRRRPREIHAGVAAAGAATSITLDTAFAPTVADYYNGMTIENITSGWVDEIDDYSTARVATISETAVKGDMYGIVSELPEPFHFLIAPRALIEARIQHPNPKSPVKPDEIKSWGEKAVEVLSSYNIGEDKLIPELLWSDVGAQGAGIQTMIPGHLDPVMDML